MMTEGHYYLLAAVLFSALAVLRVHVFLHEIESLVPDVSRFPAVPGIDIGRYRRARMNLLVFACLCSFLGTLVFWWVMAMLECAGDKLGGMTALLLVFLCVLADLVLLNTLFNISADVRCLFHEVFEKTMAEPPVEDKSDEEK